MYKVLSIKYWMPGIGGKIIQTRFLLILIALLATGYLLLVGTPTLASVKPPPIEPLYNPNTYAPGDSRALEDFKLEAPKAPAGAELPPGYQSDITQLKPTTGPSNSADSNFSNFHLTPDCKATLAPNTPPGDTTETKPCNITAFVVWVKKIINYLFYISVPIATAFILWGAFVMMKSGGNPGEFDKGKKVILSAIVGIIIIFTSNLIVTTVANLLGAKIPGITK